MSTTDLDSNGTDALDTSVAKPESRWRRLPVPARIVAVLICTLLGINLLGRFVQSSTGGGETPSGRRSSAYATNGSGLAAYAELLGREGHRVARIRGSLSDAQLDPTATLVVLDPDTVSRNDADVMLTFLVNGGRLVIGGEVPYYFSALTDTPPAWDPSGPTRWELIDPSLAPITRIVGTGDGSFATFGATEPLVGERARSLVAQTRVGRGTVVFIADASPFQNQLLATADNAALGLALVGEPGRTVVFAEGVHGYGRSRGLAAIPNHWKIALLGLGLAGLVLMWARGRRLGPPESISRELPPPRAAYVDAVGSTLARTRRPTESLEIVARSVRARIDARSTPGADGAAGAIGELDPVEFARRAHAVGMSDEEIESVLAPVTDASILAVGRALSRVEQQSTGREQR
jgi:Domain of unknown function (DUF4350)